MPTVIVIDVSLSMARQVSSSDSSDPSSYLQLAVHGVYALLDYFSTYAKLEFVALAIFSSTCEVISSFTRDFESLKSKISQLEEFDKTDIDSMVHEINTLVSSEWSSTMPCQVLLITDGNQGMSNITVDPTAFCFPCKLTSIIISKTKSCSPSLKKLVDVSVAGGSIVYPDGRLSRSSIIKMFSKVGEENYTPFNGILKVGKMTNKIVLSPTPIPFTKMVQFECMTCIMSSTIEVIGFVDGAQLGSPAQVSRHLVLPQDTQLNNVHCNGNQEEEDEGDFGKKPSLCVLLHGTIKVENAVAICSLGPDWFGILYSCSDSKKKSNLMLLALEPGKTSVQWMGNLQHLIVPELYENVDTFPLKPSEKKSYAINLVNWIRQASLQSDIQKILRHARKLPEKTIQFYKELNKLKRAAISYGFVEVFPGLASTFERECTLLPGTAHPDCALQLTYAAGILRKPQIKDPKYVIHAMRTNFNTEDE